MFTLFSYKDEFKADASSTFQTNKIKLKIIKLKTKDIQSPWIKIGIKKSSKHKQRLYEKFWKTRCKKVENPYKSYKNLFEQIKKRAKSLHFSNLIITYKNNIKMTWSVIKEAIGKNSSRRQKFPKEINLESKFITSTESIAENFTKYFAEIGPNLANKISTPLANFDTYLNNKCNIFQLENDLGVSELKGALYSLKTNKSPIYDNISSNMIKQCFDTLKRALHHIYNICVRHKFILSY